jgi:phosphoribosyl-AMP cyclohydrolase
MVGVDHIRWNNDGLVPVIAQDFTSKEILMLAWANREAVELTESTGLATYWSRSRREIWVKGKTSGNSQNVVSIKIDCDEDALIYLVQQHGPACHQGTPTCFERELT